ncbi:hypothetical protein BJ878DRAFT_116436 [Calycina marina]|uniref:Uncharacterized protein n=1 Tax=Calycina marina TaxID=1763456 RepID=A0A9P8CE63_9HELO|nr:hypothetical protein BJ878DRAFT_116436 [Calycina marina]
MFSLVALVVSVECATRLVSDDHVGVALNTTGSPCVSRHGLMTGSLSIFSFWWLRCAWHPQTKLHRTFRTRECLLALPARLVDVQDLHFW